ncbi:hypothetical protein JWG41_18210 [Leptospira sp. 201903075]|uniref:hypothetical protein n=1 Tax=Leptospira chreensis TaxID=2810035 RepID=UPI00196476FF|nr:hypothetical protein [Leptospira chreensis]MBM9592383.1 hypothetical protein [Leptospira chreensis]
MIDIMKKIIELGELYKRGEFDKCISEISEIWDSLPDPKETVPNSYLLVEYGARISLAKKDYVKAWEWANVSLKYNDIRNRMGEGEFLLGIVSFAKGDVENAKKYFAIANEKSEGRAFEGANISQYKKLLV